ncbi:hypothetical protein BsWGS_15657 [Bradybaena similaris]
MSSDHKAMFEWQDYLVFSIMLIVSSVIGLYFGIKARRQKASADEMLTGNRNLPVLPVALSLSASFTSATTILGTRGGVFTRRGAVVVVLWSRTLLCGCDLLHGSILPQVAVN